MGQKIGPKHPAADPLKKEVGNAFVFQSTKKNEFTVKKVRLLLFDAGTPLDGQ